MKKGAKNKTRNKESEEKMTRGIVEFEKEKKDKAAEKSEKKGISREQKKRQEKKRGWMIPIGFINSY